MIDPFFILILDLVTIFGGLALFLWLSWVCFSYFFINPTLLWTLIQALVNTFMWILYWSVQVAYATYVTGARLLGDLVGTSIFVVSMIAFMINGVALGVVLPRSIHQRR